MHLAYRHLDKCRDNELLLRSCQVLSYLQQARPLPCRASTQLLLKQLYIHLHVNDLDNLSGNCANVSVAIEGHTDKQRLACELLGLESVG